MLLRKKNTGCSLPACSPSEPPEIAVAERESPGRSQPTLPTAVPQVDTLSRMRDRILLGVAIAVPLLGLSMTVLGGGKRVSLGFAPATPLPQTCASRWLFGIDCPGCGLTRSIIYLMHGQLAESLKIHRLGWLFLLLIVSQIPYRLWCLYGNGVRVPWNDLADRVLWGGLIGLLVLNWTWKLLAAV